MDKVILATKKKEKKGKTEKWRLLEGTKAEIRFARHPGGFGGDLEQRKKASKAGNHLQ